MTASDFARGGNAPRAFYSENDSYCVRWLRNLIFEDLIAGGKVDGRSIEDLCSDDLDGFNQVHLFAGIGIWSLALRMAGWPDDRPVWTCSCPCQPFSQAGKGGGFDDERHLWPSAFWLVEQQRPVTIFGEQVDSPDGRLWFDLVSSDLEHIGYHVGHVVLASAGVSAPNIRHRRFWLADADRARPQQGREGCEATRNENPFESDGRTYGRMGFAGSARLSNAESFDIWRTGRRDEGRAASKSSRACHPWRELEWIKCLDGVSRPTQPGLFPLAARNPADVGKLRAYGNAINPFVATEFIKACMEVLQENVYDL